MTQSNGTLPMVFHESRFVPWTAMPVGISLSDRIGFNSSLTLWEKTVNQISGCKRIVPSHGTFIECPWRARIHQIPFSEAAASKIWPSALSKIRSNLCLSSPATTTLSPSKVKFVAFNFGWFSYDINNKSSIWSRRVVVHTISVTLTYPSERIGRPSFSAPCRRSHEIVFEVRTSGESVSRPRSFVPCGALGFLLLALAFPFDWAEVKCNSRLDCEFDEPAFSLIDNVERLSEGNEESILDSRKRRSEIDFWSCVTNVTWV